MEIIISMRWVTGGVWVRFRLLIGDEVDCMLFARGNPKRAFKGELIGCSAEMDGWMAGWLDR